MLGQLGHTHADREFSLRQIVKPPKLSSPVRSVPTLPSALSLSSLACNSITTLPSLLSSTATTPSPLLFSLDTPYRHRSSITTTPLSLLLHHHDSTAPVLHCNSATVAAPQCATSHLQGHG